MTYTTNKTYTTNSLIPPHGGYRKLKSFQMSEIVYDYTVEFCRHFIDKTYRSNMSYRSNRMADQMVQAARSGKQNIVEGCQASGTSKKTELKLLGVARASLEELLQDYLDFLRQNKLPLWEKNHPKVRAIRALAYMTYRSYTTYKSYLVSPESAANCVVCLLHQANYLLDRQLHSLAESFLEKGGFTEKLYRTRKENRG